MHMFIVKLILHDHTAIALNHFEKKNTLLCMDNLVVRAGGRFGGIPLSPTLYPSPTHG